MAQQNKVNTTFLCVYRLRHTQDLECMSGTVGRKELLEMYNLATREPCSFFNV